MLKKQKKNTIRTSRPQGSQGQFKRNSLVISRRQRETEQHKQSVAQRQNDQRRARARQMRLRRGIVAIALVVAMTVVYGLSIRSVRVQAAVSTTHLRQEYKQRIESYIASKVALRQSWLVDDAQLLEYIQEEYPEVKVVSTEARSLVGGALDATIRFREPKYIWRAANGTKFIDKDGVLFSVNAFTNVDVGSLPVVEDQSPAGSEDGSAVISSKVGEYIAYIYTDVPRLFGPSAQVISVTLPPRARAINAKVSTVPYAIKLSTERGIEQQVAELNELVAYFKDAGIQPAEYVDVRIENKAFYK
ncbi:hypothetical protein KC973_03595 [Candidatus Saccharibacteria bacterium]|nr:hypothetical protein [Candidatus Saccharibacteria bacterium]